MKMKKNYFVFPLITLSLAACVHKAALDTTAQTPQIKYRFPANTEIVPESLPPTGYSEKQSERIWKEYCVGNRNSSEIPQPNYKSEKVLSAAKKLAMIYPQSFYFYSGPLYAYGLKTGKVLNEVPSSFPSEIPEVTNGRKNAHTFLTVLCGEFRDRPSLIKDKIRWVNRLRKLPVEAQQPMSMKDHVWSKMTAESYSRYISTSVQIYNMKKNSQGQALMGAYHEEAGVEPYSICETKYIFQKYVIPGKDWDELSLADYTTQYNQFKSKCSQNDLNFLYDFRGDSNFKPNSPESNGMIWYSSTVANSCVRKEGKMVLKESMKDKFANQEICEDYFKAPFAHRWTAARAGLATWLFNSRSTDPIFSQSGNLVTVIPNFNKLNTSFDYKTNETSQDKILTEWNQNSNEFWKKPDLGFNTIMNLGTSNADKGFAFERLRNAVNRHTDWYASGYNDQINPEKTQAYSPFVASSFEMQASDQFTAPGITVSAPADGCKHWMFIFKIRKDQWYSASSIAAGKPVDFNRDWFDETSLGTNSLADHERALDRLGTALEGEMDSILYLNNIQQYGGVSDNCGASFVAPM